LPKPGIPYAELTVNKHSGRVRIFALVLNENITKENEHTHAVSYYDYMRTAIELSVITIFLTG
jgi:hypothetical protein